MLTVFCIKPILLPCSLLCWLAHRCHGVRIQMASQYQRSLTAGSMHGPQSVCHRPTVSSMLRPQSPAIAAGLEPRTTTMPGAFDSTNPTSTDTVNATALVFQPRGAPAITSIVWPFTWDSTLRRHALHYSSGLFWHMPSVVSDASDRCAGFKILPSALGNLYSICEFTMTKDPYNLRGDSI